MLRRGCHPPAQNPDSHIPAWIPGARRTRPNSLKEGIAGDPVVVDHAADGEHGEATVLELLQLPELQLLLGLSDGQPHGVKANVSGNAVGVLKHGLHGDVALVGPELHDSSPEDDLAHGGGADDGGGEVRVVDGGEAGEGPPLLHDEADGGEHGHAAVLDLGLAEPLHVEVVGEAQGIEAGIPDPALEVLGLSKVGDGLGHGRESGGLRREGVILTEIWGEVYVRRDGLLEEWGKNWTGHAAPIDRSPTDYSRIRWKVDASFKGVSSSPNASPLLPAHPYL